jgi:hypothetical protein
MDIVLSAPPPSSSLVDAIEQLHESTAYFTAEPIVEQLLDMVDWPSGARRLVDNSCGDGAFLGAALKRLLAREPAIDDARIADLVTGWEIHFFAAAEARSRLARILVDHGRDHARATAIAQKMVVHGDFLLEGPREATWDCIAGNPPFLRYAHLPSVLRDEYERALPDYSQGDLLHSFIDRCELTLRPGGEIAIVSSDRWLFTQSAARLRAVIGRRLGLHHVSRLDCSSAFYRPKNRRAGQPPRIHPVALVLREAELCTTPLTRAPIYPEARDEAFAGYRPLAEVATIHLL